MLKKKITNFGCRTLQVKDTNMASYCRCAGEFVNTIQRETFREKIKTFQNIARFVAAWYGSICHLILNYRIIIISYYQAFNNSFFHNVDKENIQQRHFNLHGAFKHTSLFVDWPGKARATEAIASNAEKAGLKYLVITVLGSFFNRVFRLSMCIIDVFPSLFFVKVVKTTIRLD